MNVNLKSKNFYKNPLLHKGLELAAKNGSLFIAGTSLTLSTIARPLAILATPKTDKENKKLACIKSISSSAVGYTVMLAGSLPIARAVDKIDKNPEKYLKPETIKNLQKGSNALIKAKRYQFATQIFKLGLGFLIAAPKSFLTAACIPHMINLFNKKEKQTNPKQNIISTNTSPMFKGGARLNPIAKGIGKIIDNKSFLKFTDKFKNTNYEMHIPALTDTVATGAFIYRNNKNKNKDIKENRIKILNNNSLISTSLSLVGGYSINKALNKPTEKFIQKFSEINKDAPMLSKYIEGIKIAKTSLILGSIYYIGIPLISTFFAERLHKNKN